MASDSTNGKTRKKIPIQLENTVLYKCGFKCCVCKTDETSVQIHHIDQNPSNNIEGNLVALCSNCHDRAHTTHQLSKNLTPSRLLKFKSMWENEISEKSSIAMLPENQGNLSNAMWTFVNHQRLPDLMRGYGLKFEPELLRELIEENLIDAHGNLKFEHDVNPKKAVYTIYDHYRWDNARRIHSLFLKAVDKIIMSVRPIELGAIWTKTQINNLISPGSICFCFRGFMFQRGSLIEGVENRHAYARAKNIELRMLVNSFHIYGTSAYIGHFVGNSRVAALIMVRDIFREGNKMVISATPIALGSGFSTHDYSSPYPLKYGWARDR
ncbi:HNH endonuclease [Pseudoalteromonas luteoviolacea]|uniref:HNH nuclease domain-containing protein n=1 Tax=Pseudoalteromonas luteoviolacea S4054 TaxID=1129367 RepID=A0A0F6ADB2_9GAMM|nr:HNH endonuclease signature motif containing protein [Pseudoalteromonas luteoviolacea]AOT08244.1 hypothetical protein S4054249_10505 [Pseudoalteromonas luteoviolacea]AOT13160.1 hypothetical protein S40542_10480 [Pseudoalteromonas luteoviolacea]AOT18072.1 hypothetical protein S4054_10475 [Pseudoalteromonas luteoviolacea]KKE84175.1 hypothetical protein N479_09760 [Pseudoalteromonas luteoviolacea S4054]KZN76220.1 hypothetical protein N481_07655 [Pseudoalteromonas luteoviolacea S4047-1]